MAPGPAARVSEEEEGVVKVEQRGMVRKGMAAMVCAALVLSVLGGCRTQRDDAHESRDNARDRRRTVARDGKSGLIFEASAEAATARPPVSVDGRLIDAYTGFGFDLLSELRKQEKRKGRDGNGGNVFISPASIALALAMTYNGASGETAKAMAKTLRLQGMSLSDANKANLALHGLLENPDRKVELNVANSLWQSKDVTFNPTFIARDKTFYRADLGRLDFSDPRSTDSINNWVSDKTRGKIPTIVGRLSAQTLFVLVNAIYFKGKWEKPFDKKKTRDGQFTLADGTRKTLPMMRQSGEYRYLDGNGFQAVALPYGSGRMSMYVFLPCEKSSLKELAGSLTSENWKGWMDKFTETPGTVALPRFTLRYEAELNDVLKARGMTPAFSANADFSNMVDGTAWIDQVLHKTFLDVNEEGTEAAAATAVVGVGAAPPAREPFEMIVNRPFFCAIRDDRTGAVLFMGSVTNPNAGK